jgi:hypothetical protein
MRVYEVPRERASEAEVAAALARLDADARADRAFSVACGLAASAIGAGLVLAGFYLVRRDTVLSSVIGVLTALLGLIALVMGVMWLTARTRDGSLARNEVAKDLARSTDLIVEIEAARIMHAPSIDDDANAIIIHDGEGHALYVNSHKLYELDEGGRKYPTIWRLILTAREGQIVGLEASGPLKEVEPGRSGLLAGAETWGEAVVLDERTPRPWRSLLQTLTQVPRATLTRHRSEGPRAKRSTPRLGSAPAAPRQRRLFSGCPVGSAAADPGLLPPAPPRRAATPSSLRWLFRRCS